MTSFREEIEAAVLDLCWSQWVELGVSGWQRRHRDVAIDPEALILFTAGLGDLDPRLRDESTDWCITNGRWISAIRLRSLVRSEPAEVRRRYGELAATIAAHSKLRWPGATEPRPYQPTRRSSTPEFDRPALITLRLRALFGVTARAEIMRLFLGDTGTELSAADLAGEAGFTKRNIAEALEALRMAGLLEATKAQNRFRYRLVRLEPLKALVGPLPSEFPRWQVRFRILREILQVARTMESEAPLVAAVEAARTLADVGSDAKVAGAAPVPQHVTGEDLWLAFRRWAVETATAWAGPTAQVR